MDCSKKNGDARVSIPSPPMDLANMREQGEETERSCG
jgi:hypothetical protein